jgi:hypothetical protein
MTPTILVAFGALVVASLVGALLAPPDYSPVRRSCVRSGQPIRASYHTIARPRSEASSVQWVS